MKLNLSGNLYLVFSFILFEMLGLKVNRGKVLVIFFVIRLIILFTVNLILDVFVILGSLLIIGDFSSF